MAETGMYAPQYVGNDLTCNSCHFSGGITRGGRRGGISLVGVAAVYPRYRERQHTAVDLITRTNDCFIRSMNGRALPPESREMRALILYYYWISRGIPICAKVGWLDVSTIKNSHAPNAVAGAAVYRRMCVPCHRSR
jgi:thiosulfate dehydrogenase